MQVMTCDNWPEVMWDTYNARGAFAFVLFPLVRALGCNPMHPGL